MAVGNLFKPGTKPVRPEDALFAYSDEEADDLSRNTGVKLFGRRDSGPTTADLMRLPLIDSLIWYLTYTREPGYLAALAGATRFMVDNVAEWWSDITRDDRSIHWDIFVNVAPVASPMWFEYKYSPTIACIKKFHKVGVLATVDYERDTFSTHKWDANALDRGIRWILRLVYFGLDDAGINVSDRRHFFSVADDGRLIGGKHLFHDFPRGAYKPQADDEDTHDTLHAELGIALMSLCFSHCKNIVVSTAYPPRPVRRHMERVNAPIYAHKVISIGTPATIIKHTAAADSDPNGRTGRALHICRGHFATYTSDKPLFGHYVGQVYKPQHARGSAQRGVITKDYNLDI